SKLVGWDIEIMTRDELNEQLEQALLGFASLEGVSEELADRLVGEGFLSYDDLSVIEPDDLMEMGGLTEEQAMHIIAQAEAKAEEAEQLAAEERRRQRQLERERAAAQAEGAPPEPPSPTPEEATESDVAAEDNAATAEGVTSESEETSG
ncbi:MAG: transcription termination factor NusA, partial [Clostridia bacterium]|nr:transcription termination factor NusA [Clostridia bacterium]